MLQNQHKLLYFITFSVTLQVWKQQRRRYQLWKGVFFRHSATFNAEFHIRHYSAENGSFGLIQLKRGHRQAERVEISALLAALWCGSAAASRSCGKKQNFVRGVRLLFSSEQGERSRNTHNTRKGYRKGMMNIHVTSIPCWLLWFKLRTTSRDRPHFCDPVLIVSARVAYAPHPRPVMTAALRWVQGVTQLGLVFDTSKILIAVASDICKSVLAYEFFFHQSPR